MIVRPRGVALSLGLTLLPLVIARPGHSQTKPAAKGSVVASSGVTVGTYRVFPYPASPVYRFPYRIEIDMQDGQNWRALPRFQNQHTDFDEPFEKAPVEMVIASGGRLLVFSQFVALPGEVMDVTYFGPHDAPFGSGLPMYLVGPGSTARELATSRRFTVTGLMPAGTCTVRLKISEGRVIGKVLDASSVEIANLTAAFHGSTLIGTVVASTERTQPTGRFRWTLLEAGREFTGVWWSNGDRGFVAGESTGRP